MALNDDEYDYLFKVVIIGDTAVGKSNLMLRFINNHFDSNSKATIGVEFGSRSVSINGKIVKAQLWDTGGQERFRAITPAFYRGSRGALIVYDITQRSTFEHVDRWLTDLKQDADSRVVAMLIGNKCDLSNERRVTVAEGIALAKRLGIGFLETSALDATNVYESFRHVLGEIIRRQRSGYGDRDAFDFDDNSQNNIYRQDDQADKIILRATNDRKSTSSKCCQ